MTLRRALAAVAAAWAVVAALGPVPSWAAAAPQATGLRFGEHGARTRVVVDFDRMVEFAARAGGSPDRLVVEFGQVDWRLGPDAGRPVRGLARGHTVEPAGDRSTLTVAMAGPVRLAQALVLPPSKDSPFHRLVVDLVADSDGAGRRPVQAPTAGAAAAGTAPVPVFRPVALAAAAVLRPPVNGHRSGAPRKGERPVVVLDPGHGGLDPGATSVDGRYEKDLVLQMARELRTLIERSGRYRVVLTREGDEFIRLRDRIAKSRRLGGQIFISLHADSLRLSGQRGASIYTLSEKASDQEAAKFAAQENKADILTGADLSQHDAVVATILIDLAQRDTNNKSIAFADVMAEELAGVTSLVKRHRRFAGFAVLKSPDFPSVLLELGYLSNPDDARNLAQSDYRAKLGRAIVRSLDRYFAVPRS